MEIVEIHFIEIKKKITFLFLLINTQLSSAVLPLLRITTEDCQEKELCDQFISELAARLYTRYHLITDKGIKQKIHRRTIESYLEYDQKNGIRYKDIATRISILISRTRGKVDFKLIIRQVKTKQKLVFERKGLVTKNYFWYRKEFLDFINSSSPKDLESWQPRNPPDEFNRSFSIPKLISPFKNDLSISFNQQKAFVKTDSEKVNNLGLKFESIIKTYDKEDYAIKYADIRTKLEDLKTMYLRLNAQDKRSGRELSRQVDLRIQLTYEYELVNGLTDALKKNYIQSSSVELLTFLNSKKVTIPSPVRFRKLQAKVSQALYLHIYNVETDELNHSLRFAEKYYSQSAYRMAREEYRKVLDQFINKRDSFEEQDDLKTLYDEFVVELEDRIRRITDVQKGLLLTRVYPYVDVTGFLFLQKRNRRLSEQLHIERSLDAYQAGLQLVKDQLEFQNLRIPPIMVHVIEIPLQHEALNDGVRDLMYDCLRLGERQNYTVYRCSAQGRKQRYVPESGSLISILQAHSLSFAVGFGYRVNDTNLIESRGDYVSFRLGYQALFSPGFYVELGTGLDSLVGLRFGNEIISVNNRTQYAIPAYLQAGFPVFSFVSLYTGVEGYFTLPMSVNGEKDLRSQRYDLYIQFGSLITIPIESNWSLETKIEVDSNLTPGRDSFVPIFSYPSYRIHVFTGVRYLF
jgi:hypothetical protein